ncbi:hypothetical protein [Alloactinosynnema sp. L-07]|uniref:hypothetical protein n=1 Tax=Alloactinosynnema sp. L-07 TaxID=1653480 RepID=UPI0006B508F8|nr:hypothetical protein [Alloactinosynnema sp. L-07]
MTAAVGRTGRGTLWRATREVDHDRIVRFIDPRFSDGRFRQALTALRGRASGRMLAIREDGWSDGQYYVEYAVDPSWRTLEERLAALPDWWDRLALLDQVCAALDHWRHGPVRPLGITAREIVIIDDQPWLAPCPPTTVASPCDLFGLDVTVVETLAPELIRGTPFDDQAQDAYALATLVAQAMACPRTRLAADDDEHRIEAQARGVLLRSTVDGSAVPATMHGSPQVERLFRTIRHYRHSRPDVRPRDASELRDAIAAAIDPVTLIGGIADGDAAIRIVDAALAREPERTDLRLLRCELAWDQLDLVAGSPADDRVDRLTRDLKVLFGQNVLTDPLWHKRLAHLHLRRDDHRAAANAFHAAAAADPSDLDALVGYARSWLALGERGYAHQTAVEANRRIDRMVRNQLLTPGEADQWRTRFVPFTP